MSDTSGSLDTGIGEIKFNPKLGFYYREGTTHLETVREPPREYAALDPRAGDVILDIGAHVGGFMGWAFKKGARRIWSVEPSPDTFEVLEMNAELRRKEDPTAEIKTFRAAAVGADAPEQVSLWVTKNHGTKASSLASLNYARGRDGITVDAIPFRRLVDELQPNVIKMDIEGGEYHLDFSNLPPCVERVAFELHWVQRKAEREKALKIAEDIESQGFKEVIVGRLKKPFREKLGWNWQVVFVR